MRITLLPFLRWFRQSRSWRQTATKESHDCALCKFSILCLHPSRDATKNAAHLSNFYTIVQHTSFSVCMQFRAFWYVDSKDYYKREDVNSEAISLGRQVVEGNKWGFWCCTAGWMNPFGYFFHVIEEAGINEVDPNCMVVTCLVVRWLVHVLNASFLHTNPHLLLVPWHVLEYRHAPCNRCRDANHISWLATQMEQIWIDIRQSTGRVLWRRDECRRSLRGRRRLGPSRNGPS